MALLKTALIATICFLLVTNRSFSQFDSVPLHNDKTILLQSKALNEPRGIWVHLPDDYASSSETYPVLYLLDGEGHFSYVSAMTDYLSSYDRNRIPKMIVVAILNVDRTRDFTPIHSLIFAGKVDSARMKTTGGGIKFLDFIQQELVPYIDSNYRTQPYRILAAHSLGGLFGLYAKETAPGLFQSTILMSPAFYGGNNKIFTDFTPFLKQHKGLKAKLFITIGDEDTQKVHSLVHQLKTLAPKSFAWGFSQYKNENHFSVTYKSMYDGLRFIYKNWFIDYYGSALMSYKDIQLHFNALSQEFGYTIKPGEELVNNCGYTQLRLGNIDGAIDIFKQNTLNFPTSFNAFDSMGEAYMAKGEKKLAIASYEKSVLLNPNNDNGKEVLKKLRGEK